MYRIFKSFRVLSLALALACGPSPADYRNQAQSALDAGDYAQAVGTADEGLVAAAEAGDRKLVWALERIRLEALARQGEGEQVTAHLERVAGEFAAQVNASLYLALAKYVKDAGSLDGALSILAAGDKRFPDQSSTFVAAIEEIKAAPAVDDATIERLKQLGYL